MTIENTTTTTEGTSLFKFTLHLNHTMDQVVVLVQFVLKLGNFSTSYPQAQHILKAILPVYIIKMQEVKYCKECNVKKLLSCFHSFTVINSDKEVSTHYSSVCEECKKKKREESTRKITEEEYKEHLKQRLKKYRETHKEQIVGREKQYRETHKEQIAAREKQYRETHKEKLAAKDKQYKETHKEQIAIKRKSNIVQCACGLELQKTSMNRHLKSPSHNQRLNSIL